jgi:hypothetical protein
VESTDPPVVGRHLAVLEELRAAPEVSPELMAAQELTTSKAAREVLTVPVAPLAAVVEEVMPVGRLVVVQVVVLQHLPVAAAEPLVAVLDQRDPPPPQDNPEPVEAVVAEPHSVVLQPVEPERVMEPEVVEVEVPPVPPVTVV